MISLVLIVLLVSLASIDCQAQQQWTLRQCMDYAIEHNISIKQQDNVRRQQELSLSTSRNSRLPDLSASASENYSFGRAQTLDGTYSNRNGFQIPNQIKLNQLNLEAATQDLEKAKNDIRMQVAQAYVQILYNMEIADVACRQLAIDSAQVKRLEAFVENGKASQAQLSQQQATLAQAQLTATQADNNLQLSVLALTQLLELPSPEGFSIVRPDNTSLLVLHSSLPSPDAVYQEALTIKPEVRAEQLRLSAADKSISIAKAALYPKLYFNAGLQTNYYKTNGMQAESFTSQMKNNFAQYLGVSLSVPIFNRFATRNNVRSARIDRENRQLQFDLVRKTLYKDIQQVYYNAVAAGSKYESSKQAQQSSQDAFKLTQAKYENGKASITEFNEAKNNYLKTESDLVQARYEYLYQTALLDFYRGRDLNF